MKLAREINPDLVGVIMKFRVGSEPFINALFTEDAVSAVTPADWWSLIAVDKAVKEDIRKILSCMTTTAELERLFSTFGFVHSSSRNRLGVEKCGKLVFCFRVLNQ